MPACVGRFIEKRFQPVPDGPDNGASFDLIRASVNLTVAALLISLATSLRLPLSTTYVTFMVAMGSSLADKAWGRDSAVYRITGVITVISGWFFTAFGRIHHVLHGGGVHRLREACSALSPCVPWQPSCC